jgi:hypothetical protein
MKFSKLRALAAVLLGAMTGMSGGMAQAADLAVGNPAPDFTLAGSDGKQHHLADYRGTAVVLAWFPKAFTGG